ncbi:MAG: glycerophosphodiester phosphodiesterase family protein [Pseudomonadota bacterium]
MAGRKLDDPGRVIAHRGASRAAPENTLAAFRLAAAHGVHWAEFDVSLLGDGTPVLIHDATLDRTTDRTGPLSALGAADLAGIDAGSWHGPGYRREALPTLRQAMALFEALGFYVNLEIKPQDLAPEAVAEAVADAVAAWAWVEERVVISSFSLECLAHLRRLLPTQPLAALLDDPPEDWPGVVADLGAGALHCGWENLTPGILSEAVALGIEVRCYTINEPDRLVWAREAGLTGVITDDPRLFLDDPAWRAWSKTW